jgi:2-polyprenyl-3-methyl-5-hydroxy-6-metoxy-1,4-benzoquinol methylase
MVAHFSSIATNLLRFNQKNVAEPWLAVDIGSNDGTFLKLMKEKGASVIGVDPAESVAKEAISRGIPTLITVFDEEAVCEIVKNFGLADVVTAFNVFAHADDLQEFTKNIVRLLKPEGIFVFEAQYLLDILERI